MSSTTSNIPQGGNVDGVIVTHCSNHLPPLPPGGRVPVGVRGAALRRLARSSCTKTAQKVVYEQNVRETLASISGLTFQD